MFKIGRATFDRNGNDVSQSTLDVRFSERQEAEDYIKDHILPAFAKSGYKPEGDYWWGREDDHTQISHFFISTI